MEVHVKELLESIQKDGIEAAEKKAKEIIDNAHSQADAITAAAAKEAKRLKEEAKEQIAREEASSRSALLQAARDLQLVVRQRLTDLFYSTLERKTDEVMTDKKLSELIKTVVASDMIDSSSVQVELSSKEGKALAALLQKELATQIEKGLEIQTTSSQKGFVITQKDGSAYVDFTIEQIAKALSVYVNPYVAQILEEAASEGE